MATFTKSSSKKEIPSEEIFRKVIHLLSLIYPILYLIIQDKQKMVFITGFMLLTVLSLDIARKFIPRLNNALCKYFKIAMRNREKTGFAGSTHFMLGVFFSILCFTQNIAILSIAVLVISDTFASITGILYGKTKVIGYKTLEGSAAFLLSAIVLSYCGSILFRIPFIPLMLASIGATILELFNKEVKCDDNILIPIGYSLISTLLLI